MYAQQARYDRIVRTLITIGTLDVDGSYTEGTRLIYYLGNPAIPYLKKEFFSNDLKRANFAGSKLIEIKNLDVINWIIRVIETHPDPKIKARARLVLTIKKNYRNLHMANRGITKEESDRLARELIDPHLERTDKQ